MEKKFDAYVYTYFLGALNGNQEVQQVHMAVSKDGLHWQELNNRKPIMINDKGTKGARDPVIVRSGDGDKFFVIATDLDANGGDWSKYGSEGSLNIVVWESDDLVNWTEASLIQLADDHMGLMWAPRAFYDKEAKEHIVYWSSNEKGQHHKHIYCARTKDFKTFTKQQVYMDIVENTRDDIKGDYITYIDTVVYEYNDTVYRISKIENNCTIFLETSDSFFGEFKLIKDKLAGEDGVEGPDIYKLNGQEKWILMMDGYCMSNPGVGYFPLIAESEDDLKNGNFRRLSPDEFQMPVGAKHGGIIPITTEEYDKLVEKYLY